ncbi:poly-gamma-glutamate biosynthesis protein PgsC [candidate division KSB1 bacterium 4484_87]|nr:MAG: poly-gamma-glutamate biosynthesis protein PgsC [candidate division KSB1 bacterium 4484_87]
METEAIFLGILLGLIYYEFVGLTPGGIIVPGYLAIYVRQPLAIVATFFAAIVTLYLVRLLSNAVVLYGRRAFVSAVLIGFFMKISLEKIMFLTGDFSSGLVIIGYIVPGLLAHEMRKQGIAETILSAVFVSAVVAVILELQDLVNL